MSYASTIAELESLLNQPELLDAIELGPRSAALDFLRFAAGTIRAFERSHGATPETEHLLQQAIDLERRFKAVDQAFFEEIRVQIRSGELTRSRLRTFCSRFTNYEPRREAHLHLSLDPLDTLVAGVFHATPPPRPTYPMAPDMVAFQPSPASALLELADRVPMGPDDVFYDLGSGLGDVVLLVHLLTGARARGVELDPGLCAYARESATALRLTDVAFVNADVRAADIGDGTVFYLFTPFTGELLADVMGTLRQVARHHRIRIGTYGPMTPVVASLAWLRSFNVHQEDPFRLALLESRETPESGYCS